MSCCNDDFYVNSCGYIVDKCGIGCGRRNVTTISGCGCFNNLVQGSFVSTIEQNLASGSLISLPTTITNNGVNVSDNNAFSVYQAGTYRVDYGVNSNNTSSATIGLNVNNTLQAGSTITVDSSAKNASNSLILNLENPSTLSLVVTNGTLNLASGSTNAFLNISLLQTS